jgi:flagellar biosynthesis protein FlhA
MTGADACWIDDPHGERAGSEGLPVWADPLQFVVVHLEAVLREHLVELLDFTAFEELLDHWAESDDDMDELIGKLLWTRRRRLDFARVLRGLVVEHVPLTRTREILETASDAGLADGEVDRAVRAIRMLLRQELPGNDGHTTLLPVPADLEHRVARWTNDRLGRDVVVLPGEETQDLLGALHRLYRSAKEPTALVTESSELRPVIRRMLATKVPTVRVLARSEVLAVQPEASAVAEGMKVGKSEDGHGP